METRPLWWEPKCIMSISVTLSVRAWHAASGATAACEDFLRHAVPGNCQIAET